MQTVDDAVEMSFWESGRGRCKVGKESLGDLGDRFEFSMFDFHSKSSMFGKWIDEKGDY